MHFTNYACGPLTRAHGGAIIAALAKPIGLCVHLKMLAAEKSYPVNVSALQVRFLKGVLQDSVCLVSFESGNAEGSSGSSGDTTEITASLRSLKRDKDGRLMKVTNLEDTVVCATAVGKWTRKVSSRI